MQVFTESEVSDYFRRLRKVLESPRNAPLVATAYHEAGHAVAAVVLGVGVGRKGVSIVPGEGRAGSAHHRKGFVGDPSLTRTAKMRRGAEKWAIICFAGEAAQRKWKPRSCRDYHFSSDYATATDMMSHFASSDKELSDALTVLHARATALVSESNNWKAIEAVASSLLFAKTLTARDVGRIVADCKVTPPNSERLSQAEFGGHSKAWHSPGSLFRTFPTRGSTG